MHVHSSYIQVLLTMYYCIAMSVFPILVFGLTCSNIFHAATNLQIFNININTIINS